MAVLALGLSAGVVVPVGAVEGVLTPTGLSASSAAGGVLLEWDAPVQDAGSVTGYRIVRRRTDVGEKRLSQLVRDTGTTSTSYLDESAFDGGVYIYRVRAMRGGLRSAISDKATITYKPPADEPAPVDTSDLSGPRSDLSGPKSDADDPVAAGVSPVWSAVLTVDAYGGSSPPSLGFWEWSRSDVGSATGGLSERHFEVGDSGITVAALFEYVEGGLMMGLSAELPEDFVLDVDGEQFVGSESFVPGLILRGRYWWPAAPRDWRTGDQVPVSITMGGPGDLTGRPKAPPSARFSHLPAGHNGIDAFTVRLNFDEAGLAVDAAMLRDDTLEVAGAGIAEVKKASAGKRAWDITLEPHGPEEIIVALGPVGGCALLGAVCTSDGRELHNHAQVVIAGLADASLASLDLMGASLGAPFDPAEALHYATSAPGASEFTVLAAAAEESAGAEVSITPADADPGEPGHQVVVDPNGETAVELTVTAPDGVATRRYWLVARSDTASGDESSALENMQMSGLEPLAFNEKESLYVLSVHEEVSQTTVVTSRAETDAIVEVMVVRSDSAKLTLDRNDADPAAIGHQVDLADSGDTLVIVRVTSGDGLSQRVYLTLISKVSTSVRSSMRQLTMRSKLTMRSETAPTLSSLSVSEGSLDPAFAADEFEYTATVESDVAEVTVTAAANGAELTVIPADADANDPGHQVALGLPGSETAIVIVASANGQLVSYVVTVSRKASTRLALLDVSGSQLTPAFDPDLYAYTATVDDTQSHATIHATAEAPDAEVRIVPGDDDPVTPGHQVALGALGDLTTTQVVVLVSAPTVAAHGTYMIAVTRPELVPSLGSLSVAGLDLTPAFDSDVFEYAVAAGPELAEATLSATASYPHMDITVSLADADPNKPGWQIPLGALGSQTVTTAVVTVTDSSTTSISYTVAVTRPELVPSLGSLSVAGLDLTPAFDSDVFEYAAAAGPELAEATLSATASYPHMDITVSPADADPNKPGWQIPLGALGSQTVTTAVVTVTDSSTTSISYTVAVTRPELVSSLGSLSVAGLDLTPAFDSDVFEYAAAAGPELAEATLSATASYPHMDITVSPADADPNKPGWQIPLGALGSQTVTTAVVTVTDSSTTSISYTIVFTRAAASPQHYAPSNLTLRSTAGGIRLRWEAPAVDGSSVTGYEIVRRQSGAGQTGSQALAQTDESVTEYLDGTVAVGGEYFYEVFAVRGPQTSPQTSLGSGETGAEYNPQMATLRSIVSRHNTLIPAFDPDIVEYELRTPHWATTVSLDVETTHSSWVFTIGSNNDPSVSGTTVDLHGNDVITIVVSGGGRLPVTYTINVTISADVSVSEGGQDFPGNISTHGRVAVGGSADAYMSDSDWIAVDLEVGKVYRINLEGHWNRFNTLPNLELISIRNFKGVSIGGTSDRDSGGNNTVERPQSRDSQLYFFPEYSGVHYVHAGHDEDWPHGPYTVSVTEIPYEDDIPADLSTSETLTVGVPTGGEIEIADDRDWFRVSLLADTMYWIEVKGKPTSSGTLRDPRLAWVHDASGVRIPGTKTETGGPQSPPWYSNDNNARLAFTPSTAGIYYISAAGNEYDNWAHHVGTYEVLVTAVSDDFAADTATTGVIEVGGVAKGIFEQKSDSDWFAVDLVAGTLYQIDLTGDNSHAAGPAGLTVIKGVYDSSGNKIPGTSSYSSVSLSNRTRVVFTPADSGIHYVSAGWAPGYELDSLGGYILKFKVFTDDCSADIDTGCAVAGPYKTIRGELEIRGDVDWYAVELDADVEYWIHIKGKGREYATGFTVGNPNLKGVYDSVGNKIPGTAADNGTVHYDSLLKFTPTETGTHYVAVTYSSSWDFPSLGTYGVEYGRVTDDFSANTTTTGTVDVDGSATGMISIVGDRDWFRVTLIPGNTYRIDIEGSATGMGTIYSPNLTGIHDSTGQKIANTSNDFGGVNSNAKLIFRANNENLTHYISVTGGASALGSYTVTVTLRP